MAAGRSILRAALSVAFLSVLPIAEAAAQTCFTGRPGPDCRSFWVTAISMSSEVAGARLLGASPVTITLEAGHAWNRSERAALGFTAFLKGGDVISGVGVRPLFRRWIAGDAAFDVAPGLRFSSNGSDLEIDLSARLGLSWKEVGIDFDLDTADEERIRDHRVIDSRSRLHASVGGRAGGWAGLVGGGGLLVLAVLFAAGGGMS